MLLVALLVCDMKRFIFVIFAFGKFKMKFVRCLFDFLYFKPNFLVVSIYYSFFGIFQSKTGLISFYFAKSKIKITHNDMKKKNEKKKQILFINPSFMFCEQLKPTLVCNHIRINNTCGPNLGRH